MCNVMWSSLNIDFPSTWFNILVVSASYPRNKFNKKSNRYSNCKIQATVSVGDFVIYIVYLWLVYNIMWGLLCHRPKPHKM